MWHPSWTLYLISHRLVNSQFLKFFHNFSTLEGTCEGNMKYFWAVLTVLAVSTPQAGLLGHSEQCVWDVRQKAVQVKHVHLFWRCLRLWINLVGPFFQSRPTDRPLLKTINTVKNNKIKLLDLFYFNNMLTLSWKKWSVTRTTQTRMNTDDNLLTAFMRTIRSRTEKHQCRRFLTSKPKTRHGPHLYRDTRNHTTVMITSFLKTTYVEFFFLFSLHTKGVKL